MVLAEKVEKTSKKGFKFYQTRSNAIILYDTLPAYCIPEGYHDGNWKSYKRESVRHLFLLQKFPLETKWMKELGSEVARGGRDSQQTQPKIQLLEQGDLFCQSDNPVRVFRKSKMFLT